MPCYVCSAPTLLAYFTLNLMGSWLLQCRETILVMCRSRRHSCFGTALQGVHLTPQDWWAGSSDPYVVCKVDGKARWDLGTGPFIWPLGQGELILTCTRQSGSAPANSWVLQWLSIYIYIYIIDIIYASARLSKTHIPHERVR